MRRFLLGPTPTFDFEDDVTRCVKGPAAPIGKQIAFIKVSESSWCREHDFEELVIPTLVLA